MRILLKKELKNSDVGSLGRIVLPKVCTFRSVSFFPLLIQYNSENQIKQSKKRIIKNPIIVFFFFFFNFPNLLMILTQREAEENLPFLSDKEGMQILIRDVNSNKKWAMKYK